MPHFKTSPIWSRLNGQLRDTILWNRRWCDAMSREAPRLNRRLRGALSGKQQLRGMILGNQKIRTVLYGADFA